MAEACNTKDEFIKAMARKDIANARKHADKMYYVVFEAGLKVAECVSELEEMLSKGVPEAEKEKTEKDLVLMRKAYENINSNLKTFDKTRKRIGTNAPTE
jgi:hypothetical protein